VGYPSRVSRACPESSTLSSSRPISKRVGGKRSIQGVKDSSEMIKKLQRIEGLAGVFSIMLRSLESYKRIFKRKIIWPDITDEKGSTT